MSGPPAKRSLDIADQGQQNLCERISRIAVNPAWGGMHEARTRTKADFSSYRLTDDGTDASSGAIVMPGSFMAARLLYRPDPVYPATARFLREQGTVLIDAIISSAGLVKHLEVISGSPVLRESAVEAVTKWMYRPFVIDGTPREVETLITLRFALTAANDTGTPAMSAASSGKSSIQSEIEAIANSNNYSPLPQPTEMRMPTGSSDLPQRIIENGTPYTLHVLMTGPTDQRVDLAPGRSTSLFIPAGAYKVAARVDGNRVSPFYGEQTVQPGVQYTSRFFVSPK